MCAAHRFHVAVVCPDGRSVVLFCKGLIEGLLALPNTEVVVLTDQGSSRERIEKMGARCLQVPLYRFFSPLRDIAYTARLFRIFRREGFDVVYNLSTKPNIYGTIAARAAAVPQIISHVVGLGSALLPATSFRARTLQAVFVALYRLCGRWSDRLWFWNENDLKFFLDKGIVEADRVLVTKTGVDVVYYAPEAVTKSQIAEARRELGIRPGERVILMIARMMWPKGIGEFVEAAKALVPRHPDWRFLLMAPLEPGNPSAVPASYVQENASAANLLWVEYRDDLRPYYALAEIKVLPSFYKEGGHPRSILEAMAMGKPVITTDNIDCCDAVEHGCNGYWVPMRDAGALAAAIERLMDDAEALRRFGAQSRARAIELFDERRIVAHALQEFGLLERATRLPVA